MSKIKIRNHNIQNAALNIQPRTLNLKPQTLNLKPPPSPPNKKTPKFKNNSEFGGFFVETEGLEPSSKQATKKLSTCIVPV